MSRIDFRACDISGATPAALEAFERALAAFQSWRSGAERLLAPALEDAPAFVMAHVLQAYLCCAVAIRRRSAPRVRACARPTARQHA
jgi:hypothetical protein